MKKILIIRFSSIGDIVLTTPVVRSLKSRYPGAEIHYLTKAGNLPLLQSNPYISKIWLYRKNFSELIPQLQKEKFDFIADLHKNLRSLFVIGMLRRPFASFRKLNFRKWLLVRTKINRMPPVHIVDRYMKVAEKAGAVNDGKGLDFFIAPEDEMDILALPPPFCSGYLAFVIGGKHNTKLFPAAKIIEVINLLNVPVILMGGKEDHARGEMITGKCSRTVLNTCGNYTIGQSASLIRQARVVITNDTGLMHIAAAFKKTIVSIWGNTVPAFGMYPYFPFSNKPDSLLSEVKNLYCRPCSKIGYEICPEGHFRCMMDQDIRKIAGFVNERRSL